MAAFALPARAESEAENHCHPACQTGATCVNGTCMVPAPATGPAPVAPPAATTAPAATTPAPAAMTPAPAPPPPTPAPAPPPAYAPGSPQPGSPYAAPVYAYPSRPPPAPPPHSGLLALPYIGVNSFSGSGTSSLDPGLRFGSFLGGFVTPTFSVDGEATMDIMNPNTPGIESSEWMAHFTFSPLFHARGPSAEFVIGPKLGLWTLSAHASD